METEYAFKKIGKLPPYEEIVKLSIRHSEEQEQEQSLETMRKYFDSDYLSKPCVGLFWYDENRKELFGARKEPLDSYPTTTKSINVLHRDVWLDEIKKREQLGKNKYPFIGKHEDTARGRIFFEPKTNIFQIKVGDWIYENPDAEKEIVVEFNLLECNAEIVFDLHWNKGSTWKD
jgi:hypothetical protein